MEIKFYNARAILKYIKRSILVLSVFVLLLIPNQSLACRVVEPDYIFKQDFANQNYRLSWSLDAVVPVISEGEFVAQCGTLYSVSWSLTIVMYLVIFTLIYLAVRISQDKIKNKNGN